ncbi:RNA-binding protein-like protein [Leishmania tarentolae]|uniref:RNA-binding protein-like protein n=1 Tax=Leishmania tarentolae TaxID=5689 RepID=A0A640KEM7_LEITA|nr:RNA-binding protein-like protein [Leishmania tarentolae]
MYSTDNFDMTAPAGDEDGALSHTLASPENGAGGVGPPSHRRRQRSGLDERTDALRSDEGHISVEPADMEAPKMAGVAPLIGGVHVCGAFVSPTDRHRGIVSHGLRGADSEFPPTVGPAIHDASSPAQEMTPGSAVAATSMHLPASVAPAPSCSSRGQPLSTILMTASVSDGAAAAAASYVDPLAGAVVASGSTTRSSSVGVAHACASTGIEDLYSDHYVNPLLRSRSCRSGGSSALFSGGAGDDEDGSAALQAAVDAAVRFDDLASEDDLVSGGAKRRMLQRAGSTALPYLLAVADDTDDGAIVCDHTQSVGTSNAFDIPSRLDNGGGERHQPQSPQTPIMQQCGRRGHWCADGPQQMPNRAAIGAAAVSSSAPYFSVSGSAIASPLQSMQALASPAAAAPNSATTIAASTPTSYTASQGQPEQQPLYSYIVTSAGALAKLSAPTSSLASPPQSSMPVSPSMNEAQHRQPRNRHPRHQCSSSLHPSPHGRKASPEAVPHSFPAGATAIRKLGSVGNLRYVSPPHAPIAATHHHSVSGASRGRTTVAQNSSNAISAAPPGTTGSRTDTGVGVQTPSNSLLSSPSAQPFYLYQLSQATLTVEPQQAQQQLQDSANVLLYSPPQAYVTSGQVVAAQVHPATPTAAAAAAVLGDSTRAHSTSTPKGSYQLPAVTQQQQQKVIGRYTVTPSAHAAAAAAAAVAAAATSSEESDRASRNLYFRNLPHSWNTSMLRELCGRYGTVLSAKVAHHSTTNESLGYGFVLFEHKHSAVACMTMLNQAHVNAEGEESRTLFVRMAHATAAPGFQEEGASDSTASSLRHPTDLKPLSRSVSRVGVTGGKLPQWILQQQQQQQQQQHQPTGALCSPRTPLSGSASMMLLSPGSAPQLYSHELCGAGVADTQWGPVHHHSIGDSARTNVNPSSNTSCAGGDSLRCTSPVDGAGNNGSVAVSRASMQPSFSDTCMLTGTKGAAKASAPPLRGLYRAPSTNTTPSLLSPHPPHQPPQQQERSLSYSSASANRPSTSTATGLAVAAAQRAGYSFCSPLSLSPNDTASLLLLSPPVRHPTVQRQQPLHTPYASVSGKPSSAQAAPAAASATTSTRNVYITNLPLTWNTTKLRELCGQYGEIVSAAVAHHPETNESRGYGFVLFADERDAASCVRTLHQQRVPGSSNVLSCRYAKDKATPAIAHTLLSPSQESGLDSFSSGSGSPLPIATVGGSLTTATSRTWVPMIARSGDADTLERSLAGNATGNRTRGSVEATSEESVCMPIDVFCTLQQRVHAQCVQYLTQTPELQRRCTEKRRKPTSTVTITEVQSDELEKMMRFCVVYGAHVPTQGYGCVRPMDCRQTSFRRGVARSSTVTAVEDTKQLFSGPPAEPSTPASSGLRSVGSALSTELGDPNGEVHDTADTAAPVTLSGTVVCTHAIAAGRTQPASLARPGAGTIPAVLSTGHSTSDEPLCAPPRGSGASDAESVSLAPTPEAMTLPVAPQELWYTCTLFTTPSAAEEFVQAAAEAASGSGATIKAARRNLVTSSGSVADASTVQLSFNGKDAPAESTLPSPSLALGKRAEARQMRFGLRDQVVVLSSAPLVVPAAMPCTSLASTTAANNTRLLTTEESYSQQQPTAALPQQQHEPYHLRPSHRLPSPTSLHTQMRDDSATASTTPPCSSHFSSATGIAATPAHPTVSVAGPVSALSQPLHLPQQQSLCSPSSTETLLCSLPSHAAPSTYPRVALTSPTDGASLTNSTPMMKVMGGDGDGSSSTSSTVAPLAFPQDLVAHASSGAGGRYPSATTAECAYLLGSPSSTTPANLRKGTHILSGSSTPPLAVALACPSVPSPHSTVLHTTGAGSLSGHPASAVHAAPAVFAAAPSYTSTSHAWTAATGGAAASMLNMFSAPAPVISMPTSSSPEQAPPSPLHLSYPLGSVIYAMPEAAALTTSSTRRPPVLLNAVSISSVVSSAAPASPARVMCTTPNSTSQHSAQSLHP